MVDVNEIVLTFSCRDAHGIVAAVASLFADRGFNIKESSQFEDVAQRRFFMRTVFQCPPGYNLMDIKSLFEPVCRRYEMIWQIFYEDARHRVPWGVFCGGQCVR